MKYVACVHKCLSIVNMPNKSCFTFIEVKYTLVGYHYFCIFNLEKVKQNYYYLCVAEKYYTGYV